MLPLTMQHNNTQGARPYWPCRCCRSITWQAEEGEWVCGTCAFPAGEIPTHEELITLGPSPGRPYTACTGCKMGGGWGYKDYQWICLHCKAPYVEPTFIPIVDDLSLDKTLRAQFGGDRRGRVFTIATQAQEA